MVYSVLFVIVICILLDSLHVRNNLLYLLIGILLVLMATFSDRSSMPDYGEYVDAYKYGSERIEYSFVLIAQISKSLGSISYLFFIYACISIGIKMYLIKKISLHYWASLALYLSYFFVLHDLIQIRAGAASAFLLLSFYMLYKDKIKAGLLFWLLAIFFHYSAVIGIAAFFFKKIGYDRKKWTCVFIGGLIIGITGVLLLPSSLEGVEVLQYYLHYSDESYVEEHGGINFISVQQTVRYLVYFGIMYLSRYLDEKRGIFWFRLYFFGTLILCVASVIPAFAFRLSDLFYVTEIFVIPNAILQIKNGTNKYLTIKRQYMFVVLINIIIVCFVSKYLIL